MLLLHLLPRGSVYNTQAIGDWNHQPPHPKLGTSRSRSAPELQTLTSPHAHNTGTGLVLFEIIFCFRYSGFCEGWSLKKRRNRNASLKIQKQITDVETPASVGTPLALNWKPQHTAQRDDVRTESGFKLRWLLAGPLRLGQTTTMTPPCRTNQRRHFHDL